MREKQTAILALALGLALLAGCQRPAAPAPTPSPAEPTSTAAPTPAPVRQVFTLPVDPVGGWDPYVGSQSGNQSLLPLLCESLFELNESFEPQPVLAKSAEVSEDGLVWTLTLRDGVTFSNGQVFNAAMAAQAVKAARGEKSVYRARLAGIKNVVAREGETLVFTLWAPNASFPALLDFPLALVDGDRVWGTGPYVLRENALVARADWWQGKALPLREIPLEDITNDDDLITAFRSGALSVVAADPTGAATLGFSSTAQNWEYATSNMLYLGFQCARGPCRQAAFRRAVNQALDRADLTLRVLQGHATPATLPSPVAAENEALKHDPQAAALALEELGYALDQEGHRSKGRTPLRVTLVVNSDNPFKESLAQAIARELEGLGIGVEVRSLGWTEYQKALEKGEFDLYLAECRLTGDLDPSPFFTKGSGLCYGGFSSKALSAALAEGRRTGEWAAFYTQWGEDAPLAVIGFKHAQLLTQWGQVTGASPTQGNLFHHFETWSIAS